MHYGNFADLLHAAIARQLDGSHCSWTRTSLGNIPVLLDNFKFQMIILPCKSLKSEKNNNDNFFVSVFKIPNLSLTTKFDNICDL